MTVDLVTERMQALRSRIDAVERPWDHPIRIVGVTKGHGPWAVDAAVTSGCDAIGENYAQELAGKADAIRSCALPLHFIGRLQTNKVRGIVGLVDVWSTLDRTSVIDEVAKRAGGARVLIQVNSTDEDSKGGCRPADVAALIDHARDRGLTVVGLMTVGPTGQPPQAARRGFRVVRTLVDEHRLAVCSMGMSDDLDIAIEEGATELRIGSALFGSRASST